MVFRFLPRNRLRHVSDELFRKFMGFSLKNPDVISPAQMLQKLVIFDFVAPNLRKLNHPKILEIGCGQGVHACLLSQFGEVCATELKFTEKWMGQATAVREKTFQELAAQPVHFEFNDGERLPFGEKTFDLVFHNSVIEHVPDIRQFNREIHRVLKPGGKALCITGTPRLCWYRFIRFYLALLPAHILRAFYKEIPSYFSARKRKRRIDEVILEQIGSRQQRPNSRRAKISAYIPQLYHFVQNPEYTTNRLIMKHVAQAEGLSFDEFLEQAGGYFAASFWHRLRFWITPQTHGQIYRNFVHEAKNWEVQRWAELHQDSGLRVDKIFGYRYHHYLEWTGIKTLNSWLYLRFANTIHRNIKNDKAPPHRASEFILIAERSIS